MKTLLLIFSLVSLGLPSSSVTDESFVDQPTVELSIQLEDCSVVTQNFPLAQFLDGSAEVAFVADLNSNIVDCTAYVKGWGDRCKVTAATCEAAVAGAMACLRASQ